MRRWPWSRRRPRPVFRRAIVAPALLATIGVLAAVKFALVAQDAARALSTAGLAETVAAGKAPPADDMEPAAGPGEKTSEAGAAEHGAARPPPQAQPARAPAEPAQRLAPGRLSPSEIEVLQQLAERRATLERREQDLDRRAALLATAEANVATQLERLEQLRAEIAATIATHDAKEDEKLASLVKIYETMKPKAAAEIFDRLEMPILIKVVERMRAPKSADVLARMDPAKAKQVTAELARRTDLLRAAGRS
jgi:flagellar motility protein MotE (MotC chaperone)